MATIAELIKNVGEITKSVKKTDNELIQEITEYLLSHGFVWKNHGIWFGVKYSIKHKNVMLNDFYLSDSGYLESISNYKKYSFTELSHEAKEKLISEIKSNKIINLEKNG